MGRTQTLETVGIGVTDVVVDVVLAVQTPAVVVGVTTTGGFFWIQSLLLQLLPTQVLLQYWLTLEHQDWYLAHCSEAGQPAVRKQSAIWRIHSATATLQDGLSSQVGRGFEHHFPQEYSQVGAGAVAVHLVLVVVVEEVLEVEDVLLVVDVEVLLEVLEVEDVLLVVDVELVLVEVVEPVLDVLEVDDVLLVEEVEVVVGVLEVEDVLLEVLEVDDVVLVEEVELLLEVLVVEDVLEVEDVELVLDVLVVELGELVLEVLLVLDVLGLVGTMGGGSWNGVQGSEDMRSLAT